MEILELLSSIPHVNTWYGKLILGMIALFIVCASLMLILAKY